MIGKSLFACMDENSIIYECRIFKGHLFRRYANGFIESASDEDGIAASHFANLF